MQHPQWRAHLRTLWEVTACVEFPRLPLSKSIRVCSGSASRLGGGERLLSVEWLTLVTALLQSRHDLNSLFELPLTPNSEETRGAGWDTGASISFPLHARRWRRASGENRRLLFRAVTSAHMWRQAGLALHCPKPLEPSLSSMSFKFSDYFIVSFSSTNNC